MSIHRFWSFVEKHAAFSGCFSHAAMTLLDIASFSPGAFTRAEILTLLDETIRVQGWQLESNGSSGNHVSWQVTRMQPLVVGVVSIFLASLPFTMIFPIRTESTRFEDKPN